MASIDAETQGRLLRAARSAIEADLLGERADVDDAPWPPLKRAGVFVTLWKGGHLRGCIGTFEPCGDLPATVRRMAAAAAHDPRFLQTPLSVSELGDVRIEVSVLSSLKRIDDPLAFELGTHGIHVRRGFQVGCFLPEVATECGWDKEAFLTHCCRQKAGMEPLAWKQDDTEVSIFSVEKFGD
jgi:AmmeMemoRadiSam system protein A